MNQWICEDVGLVLNEIREKLKEKEIEYTERSKNSGPLGVGYSGILAGLNVAETILNEVEKNWTADEPPEYILDKVRGNKNGR